MKNFMDKDFLLKTETAKHLFHTYAENMPLVDYHCHIDPKEIYENRRFSNLHEAWLEADHYKWRLMRSNGIDESYITGEQTPFDCMKKYVEALEPSIGNPLYHWTNLELRKYFGYEGYLCSETVDAVWNLANRQLQEDENLTVRGLIAQSKVAMIGTTDDPIDSLEWHKKLADDPTFTTQVCPSFRPDNAINIGKAGFVAYIGKLAASVGKDALNSVEEICAALTERLEFFVSLGCRATDHGLDYIPYVECTMEQANAIYQKAIAGQSLTKDEIDGYQTVIMMHLAQNYHRLDIAMQLHYSCLRDMNQKRFEALGSNSGFDMVGQNDCIHAIAKFLSALDYTNQCPKTIIYSLDAGDYDRVCALIGCFQNSELAGKLQHGSGWWFNDTKTGMEAQMISLANLSILGNFVGMLTDSRSFLSYARHDYFRRIMCNLIGQWVEDGEYPNDEKALQKIVEGISFNNAARYFNL
ncbi:glucuronate isomerase [Bengtsoniella intestinalis]|uniref:glucuronate isomerase n=1 Tax=Bengtsoniella intestinalis TaxID=3073143 RepID=UPI00391F13D5